MFPLEINILQPPVGKKPTKTSKKSKAESMSAPPTAMAAERGPGLRYGCEECGICILNEAEYLEYKKDGVCGGCRDDIDDHVIIL
jgi:hypothetical protein